MERNTEAEAWKAYLVKEQKKPKLFEDVQKLVSTEGISYDDAFFLKAPQSPASEKKIRGRIEEIIRHLTKDAAEVVPTIEAAQKDDLTPINPADITPETYKESKQHTIDDAEEVFEAKTIPPVKKPSKLEEIANAGDPTKSMPPAESFGLQIEADGSAIPVVESEDVRKAGAKKPYVSKKLIGTGFDKFIIQEKLSEGGMGAVFIALDQDTNRTVVLKVGKRTDPDAQSRFQKEKEVHAQIEHDNVAPIYEGGFTTKETIVPPKKAGERPIKIPAGVPFFAMKMLHGQPLSKLIDKMNETGIKPDVNQILQLFKGACYGVKAMHDKGLIHRDLKPDNLWHAYEKKGEEKLLVLDLGLAKKIKDVHTDDATKKVHISQEADMKKTLEGAIAGTILYMSPEQAEGKISELDERSDIYALGTILYEMLTLDTMIDPTGGQINALNRVITQEITWPKNIPKDVLAILKKMLERDKTTRYRKLNPIITDIEKYSAGKPVSARKYNPIELVGKWYTRNKLFTIPATVALMLVLAGGTVAQTLSVKASRAEARTATAETETAKESAKAEKALKEKAQAEAKAAVATVEGMKEAQKKRDEANKIVQIGDQFYRNDAYDHAIAQYSRAIKIDTSSAGARYNRALAFRKRAMKSGIDETKLKDNEDIKNALEDIINAVKIDNTNTVYQSQYAQLLELAGRISEAEEQFDKATKIEKPHPVTLYNFGSFYSRQHNHNKAIEWYKKYSGSAPDDKKVYYEIGSEYYNWGKKEYEEKKDADAKIHFAEAERFLTMAREHRPDKTGKIDELLANIKKAYSQMK